MAVLLFGEVGRISSSCMLTWRAWSCSEEGRGVSGRWLPRQWSYGDWRTILSSVDPCEAAKFNLIKYFSTQDFGIDIQSSIFQDKNLTFLNDQVFFNAKFFNIKTIEYFSTQILNIQPDNAKRS